MKTINLSDSAAAELLAALQSSSPAGGTVSTVGAVPSVSTVAAPGEPQIAENWVRVRPPYPKGVKYRDYPNPKFVSSATGAPVETILGYASSAQNLWNCPHFDYNSQGGRLIQLSAVHGARLQKEGTSAYPGILDEVAFPNDYSEKVAVATGTWVSSGGGQPPGDGFEPVPES